MKRLVAGVVVALMLVGTLALSSGCGSKTTPAAGGASKAAGGSAGATGQTAKLPDAQIKQFIQTMPKDSWEKTQYAKQIEAYAAKHPDVKYQGGAPQQGQ